MGSSHTRHIHRDKKNKTENGNKPTNIMGNVSIIYIEEIGSSLAIRGRSMHIGLRLIACMLVQYTEHRTEEYHLTATRPGPVLSDNTLSYMFTHVFHVNNWLLM